MSKTRARRFGRQSNGDFGSVTFPIKGLSQFDWSHTTSFTNDFGYLRPIECDDLILGTRMRCNLAYVLNMDPLRKPLYAGISVTFDAIYVSDNLLGYDSPEFFNAANHLKVGVAPTDEEQPFFYSYNLLYLYYTSNNYWSWNVDNHFVPGSTESAYVPKPIYNTLYESLGYPFNSEAYDELPNLILTLPEQVAPLIQVSELMNPFSSFYSSFGISTIYDRDQMQRSSDLIVGGISAYSSSFWRFYEDFNMVGLSNWLTRTIYSSSKGSNSQVTELSPAANILPIQTYWRYMFWHADAEFLHEEKNSSLIYAESDTDFFQALKNLGYFISVPEGDVTIENCASYIDFDKLLRDMGYDSFQASLDVYRSYLYAVFFVRNESCDMRPIFAYRVAYNDLYVNTNIHDCDDYRADYIDRYYDKVSVLANLHFDSNADLGTGGMQSRYFDISLEKRWWSNDMFTSAVPSDMSSAANSIEIPSTGLTVQGLRNLNVNQMVADKLAYAGSRPTDTNFAFFGFKSPELNYRYARHIGRIVDSPRVDNVLQNSESTAESPLATPAGYGYGSKSSRFFDYQMPWYGFIMILQSVMTEPVYRDSVDRMLYKKDYEDFLFPDYQEVGDVSVQNNEIQAFRSGVFGWQRSYYYYIRKNSTIRGCMRFNEKIDWNLSRDMRDGFALNKDFCRPDSSDRLDRIFANTSDGVHHFNFFVGFDMQVVEPLRRDIHYHL